IGIGLATVFCIVTCVFGWAMCNTNGPPSAVRTRNPDGGAFSVVTSDGSLRPLGPNEWADGAVGLSRGTGQAVIVGTGGPMIDKVVVRSGGGLDTTDGIFTQVRLVIFNKTNSSINYQGWAGG